MLECSLTNKHGGQSIQGKLNHYSQYENNAEGITEDGCRGTIM